VRLDVREETRRAAAAEFRFNGVCLALVSPELVDQWTDWSPAVQLMAQRGEDGLVEFSVREVQAAPEPADAQLCSCSRHRWDPACPVHGREAA
jgi:hypothetical protein